MEPALLRGGDQWSFGFYKYSFAAKGTRNPNIEDTLLFASREALEKDDLRVLSVLVTWLGVHAAWINADRLTRLVAEEELPKVRAFWAAVGRWLKTDRRFAWLVRLYRGRRLDLLAAGTAGAASWRGPALPAEPAARAGQRAS